MYIVKYYSRIIIQFSSSLSVKLDDDENLPQLICVECKTSIETFVRFCDKIDNHQVSLRKTSKVPFSFKEEAVDLSTTAIPASDPTTHHPEITLIHNYSKSPPLIIHSVQSLTDLVTPSTSESADDHLEEQGIMNDDGEDTRRQNDSSDDDLPPIVRQNVDTLLLRCKTCSIPINRLLIEFVASDSEEDDNEKDFSKKRSVNNNLEKIVNNSEVLELVH